MPFLLLCWASQALRAQGLNSGHSPANPDGATGPCGYQGRDRGSRHELYQWHHSQRVLLGELART